MDLLNEDANRLTAQTNYRSVRPQRKRLSIIALSFIMAVFVVIGAGCDSGGINPPASVTFRESMLDSSKVMQITNRSGSETLVMKLWVCNHTYKQNGTHVFKVKPGETYEIGRLEMGWRFLRGENYYIKAEGYVNPIEGTVP